MNCLQCGSDTKNPKFCGASCSATYNNLAKPKKTKKELFCAYCGKTLIGSALKFCSIECSTLYARVPKRKSFVSGELNTPKLIKVFVSEMQGYNCAICNTSSWNNKELVLVLDHIDGNATNNYPSNLRLVCPNCDSQLPTFKSINRGKGRFSRRERYAAGKSC